MRKFLSALLLTLCVSPSMTQQPQRALNEGLVIHQRLESQLPLDAVLRNEDGQEVKLGEYFNKGRPVVLMLVFYQCRGTCTQGLNGMVTCAKAMKTLDIGRDYDIVTVSIHPKETPEMARDKKEAYLQIYGREGGKKGWHFLVGDMMTVRSIADAVGFKYIYDAEKNTVRHPSGVMVITPEGKVSRYFFGTMYPQKQMLAALDSAASGQIGTAVEKPVYAFCIQYDPNTGRYTLLVTNALVVLCLLTVGVLGSYIFVQTRKYRYDLPKAAEEPDPSR